MNQTRPYTIDDDENISVDGMIWHARAEEIPDQDFYLLIEALPELIQAPFVLQKIKQWQTVLNGSDTHDSSRARKQLEKIGLSLAKKKQVNVRYAVAYERALIYNKLIDAGVIRTRNKFLFLERLKELFPEIQSHVFYGMTFSARRTCNTVSAEITAKKLNLSYTTVERYCKEKGVSKYYQLCKNGRLRTKKIGK